MYLHPNSTPAVDSPVSTSSKVTVDSTGEIRELSQKLISHLAKLKAVGVAFSGGVDSAVVAKAAYLACSDKSWAFIGISPSLAQGEEDYASQTAAIIGIPLVRIETQESTVAGYIENSPRRCYFCKNELYTCISAQQAKYPFQIIVNGANADDASDYRPGMQAATEHQVLSPLLELGITKLQVRQLAQLWNLPVWDKPASPCLASRIAYGINVTPAGMNRVDQAERYLKQRLNIRNLRVRDLGQDQARIEVPRESIPLVTHPDHHQAIWTELHRLGFKSILLDLAGFRSGSLNELVELK
jgi:uncharacterized protein